MFREIIEILDIDEFTNKIINLVIIIYIYCNTPITSTYFYYIFIKT